MRRSWKCDKFSDRQAGRQMDGYREKYSKLKFIVCLTHKRKWSYIRGENKVRVILWKSHPEINTFSFQLFMLSRHIRNCCCSIFNIKTTCSRNMGTLKIYLLPSKVYIYSTLQKIFHHIKSYVKNSYTSLFNKMHE